MALSVSDWRLLNRPIDKKKTSQSSSRDPSPLSNALLLPSQNHSIFHRSISRFPLSLTVIYRTLSLQDHLETRSFPSHRSLPLSMLLPHPPGFEEGKREREREERTEKQRIDERVGGRRRDRGIDKEGSLG